MIYLQKQEPLPLYSYNEPIVVCGTSPRDLKAFVQWMENNPNKPFRKLIIPYTEDCLSIGDYLLLPEDQRKPVRSTIKSYHGKKQFEVSPIIQWTDNKLTEFSSWPIPEDFTTGHIFACAKMPPLRAFICDTIDGLSQVQRLACKKTPGNFKSICLSVANECYVSYQSVQNHLLSTFNIHDPENDYLPLIKIRIPFLHLQQDFKLLVHSIIAILDNESVSHISFMSMSVPVIHQNRYCLLDFQQAIRLFLSLQIECFPSIEFQQTYTAKERLKGLAIYNMKDTLFQAIDKSIVIKESNTKFSVEELLETPVKYVSPFVIMENEQQNVLTELEQLRQYLLNIQERPSCI